MWGLFNLIIFLNQVWTQICILEKKSHYMHGIFQGFFQHAWHICHQFVGCPGVLDCSITLRHSHEICAGWCGGHHIPDYYIRSAVSGLQRCQLWEPPQRCWLQGQFLSAEAAICFPQQLLPKQSAGGWGADSQGHPLFPHQCHRPVWQQEYVQRWD